MRLYEYGLRNYNKRRMTANEITKSSNYSTVNMVICLIY
ncbi:hypothetical protein Golax_003208 [Gossypium laxum]|uniref:Uncharacterized protein n=1 Tax=Gossypium laxum TaxID=34288 RepID=A0A7J9AEV0_9ROSI|nr:hypothetical protein [Gossypium laxum]